MSCLSNHYLTKPQRGFPHVNASLCEAGQTHALRAWSINTPKGVGDDDPLLYGPIERPLDDADDVRQSPVRFPVLVAIEPAGQVDWQTFGNRPKTLGFRESLQVVLATGEAPVGVRPFGMSEVEVNDGCNRVVTAVHRWIAGTLQSELVPTLLAQVFVLPATGELELLAAGLDVPPSVRATEPRICLPSHDEPSQSRSSKRKSRGGLERSASASRPAGIRTRGYFTTGNLFAKGATKGANRFFVAVLRFFLVVATCKLVYGCGQWAAQDSNLRLPPCEDGALTN